MTVGDRKFFVHRASRTERLAETLMSSVAASMPTNPLQAQTIVVAHPGLRRWLLGTFARRDGIAANFDMILPWQWLQRTAAALLGDAALIDGDYGEGSLRWHIFHALPHVDAAAIRRYCSGEDAERRRFELADHLAGVYTQYLVYRPEWILGWDAGDGVDDWQAELWRHATARIELPHRARRSLDLVRKLDAVGDGESLPLHVFGASHLAPDVLAALQAVSRHRQVHLYFPDPCREHWVFLRARRSLLRMEDAASGYFEIGHPLLAALGRMGQEFCLRLDELDAGDERDESDDVEAAPENMLAAMQSSIRCMKPEIVGAEIHATDAATRARHLLAMRADASLRVHACHTRLRELEVLKDALLAFLAEDPTLQPRDIVVMVPGIGAYAPYLGAVFGEPARYSTDPARIPWHLADVSLAQQHPLLGAFNRLLDLAQSRFRVSDVLGFLDTPAIARRFHIDAEARASLENCLRRTHIAWGLDARMKADAGAAPVAANSWAFGFDRMYAGYVVGSGQHAPLFDGILPAQGIGGGGIEAIGRLATLLDALRALRAGFAERRTLTAWCAWLLEIIETFFAADWCDDAESDALYSLRRAVAALNDEASATADEPVGWPVMREAVRGAMAAIAERQPFLLGGVTFCGLVPQRSIPFRVVCMLGMTEGEFPRPGADAGLNRILAKPRPGDRDTRSEDRYLFLEALMAARSCLHISYIGEGVSDGKRRNPASPLAELLQFLDDQHGIAGGEDDRPWLVRHPLQPFDERYYQGDDARVFSYERAYVDIPARRQDEPAFLDLAMAAPRRDEGEVTLVSLKRFWRDPAKTMLRDDFGLNLGALDDNARLDTEPLQARADPRERIGRCLLFDALAERASTLPTAAPAWLAKSGVLAAGEIGERAYAGERDVAQKMLDAAREVLGADYRRDAQAVDVELEEGVRLVGVVDHVFRCRDGRCLLFDAKPHGAAGFRELIPFYIDLAALRLTANASMGALFLEFSEGALPAVRPPPLCAVMEAQSAAQLREGLCRMIEAMRAARGEPLLFMPKSAWAWVSAEPDKRENAASSEWLGGYRKQGERNFSPGYAALLTRGLDLFKPGSVAYSRFVDAATSIADVLDPGRSVLLPQSRRARGGSR
jgi:exodeoxyribonuclease V gamma subunit